MERREQKPEQGGHPERGLSCPDFGWEAVCNAGGELTSRKGCKASADLARERVCVPRPPVWSELALERAHSSLPQCSLQGEVLMASACGPVQWLALWPLCCPTWK